MLKKNSTERVEESPPCTCVGGLLGIVPFPGLCHSISMANLKDFYFQTYGPESAAKKWVFVHGLMGAGQNWRKVIGQLEKTDQCLAYDQRGHGRSFQPPSGYAPKDYTEDLKFLTDQLGWDQFILVGHSMGGRTAFHFASTYPEKVSHLIIEDIGPEENPRAHEYFEKLLGVVPEFFPSRSAAKEFFQTEFLKKAQTKDKIEAVANFLYTNIIELEDGRATFRFNRENIIETVKLGRSHALWENIARLKMPTLWIRGENSLELSIENFNKIGEINPQIQRVTIPRSGHWVHIDQPQLFHEAICHFIEQHPRKGF